MKVLLSEEAKYMAMCLEKVYRRQATSVIIVSFQNGKCVKPDVLEGLSMSALRELRENGLIDTTGVNPVKVMPLPDLGVIVAQNFKGLTASGVEAAAAQSSDAVDTPGRQRYWIAKTIWVLAPIALAILVNVISAILSKLLNLS